MSNRIVDEMNIESAFNSKQIKDLLADLNDASEPPIPCFAQEYLASMRDDIVSHICHSFPHHITEAPFEHESLLLDNKETKLSDYEKKQALQIYKAEKSGKQNNLTRFGHSNYVANYTFGQTAPFYSSPAYLPAQVCSIF